jgi:phage-related baseplate assembly protein
MTRYAIVSNMFGSENYYRYISVDFTGDIADSSATSPAGDPFANYETLPQSDGPEYQDS